jgi:hypothetical protein
VSWRRVPRVAWDDGRRVEDAYRRALAAYCLTCGAAPGRGCRGPKVRHHAERLARFLREREAAGLPPAFRPAQVGLAAMHRDRAALGWTRARLDLPPALLEAASGPLARPGEGNPNPAASAAEAGPEAPPRPATGPAAGRPARRDTT